MGRKVPIELIRKHRSGNTFLEYQFDGALPVHGIMWYPEDMAVKPAAFLEGLDEGEFGMREGLRLWLQLHSEGFMETDLQYAHVRQLFEKALAESSPPLREPPLL